MNTVIGNQSLLNVSSWLDHLKCICLDGIVLIVYVCYWTFRSLAAHYPFTEGPSTSQFVLYMSLICSYFHCPTVNHRPQLYYVVLAQPFHSSLCSVHYSPSTVALMLSIILFHSTLTPQQTVHHFPSTHITHHTAPHTVHKCSPCITCMYAHWKCNHSSSIWALAPVSKLNNTSLCNFI